MRSRRVGSGIEIAGFDGPVHALLLRSPAGGTELVTAAAGRLVRWEAGSGRLVSEFEVPRNASTETFASRALVLADGRVRIAAGDEDGLCLWDGVSGRLLADAVGKDRIHDVALGLTSGGRPLLAGAGANGLHLWDPVTAAPLTPLLEHVGEPAAVTLAALRGGPTLIVTGDHEGVRRWQGDFCDSPFGAQIDAPHIDMLTTAYTEDGRSLIVGVVEEGEAVCRWDAETGEEVGTPIPTDGEFVRIATATVSGRLRLFTADHDVVRQWDLLSGEPFAETFVGSFVSTVSLQDGSALLAAGTKKGGRVTTHHLV
ncbi:WD40 repeat domain-containing protein [Streptomyces fructofermentans]|uniref:WD40 repeat domain-containing protein n=1 Tax=Streptomyces fructofermentans TaxID=152141 RepID=UPI003788D56F